MSSNTDPTQSTLAMVFPGQGSQSVGMLGLLGAAHPVVRETFQEASDVLGYDLWSVVDEGPEDALNRTACTQPAMLVAGIAVWRAWRAAGGPEPAVLAGHSLGEYTALVCAGSLGFADAVALTRARGTWMQEAVPVGVGAMAAILGLGDDWVRALCREGAAGKQVVEAVNFNAPGQVVIAGHAQAVERTIALARAAGARRALSLPVSVPSHCRLMAVAARRLGERLRETDLRVPRIPVVQNADVRVFEDPEDIRAALTRQLDHPVRWVEVVQAMAARGVRTVIECGPGRVLTGLVRRIDRGLTARCIGDPQGFEEALAGLATGTGSRVDGVGRPRPALQNRERHRNA